MNGERDSTLFAYLLYNTGTYNHAKKPTLDFETIRPDTQPNTSTHVKIARSVSVSVWRMAGQTQGTRSKS
ncbi:MAG: hypothetical protein ACW99Q_18970 [Candidatus Kariarchaeaceae archaeon]